MKRHISYVLSLWVLLMSCLALTGCGNDKVPKIQLSEADDTGIYTGETIPFGELEGFFSVVGPYTSENYLYILAALPVTESDGEAEEWEVWMYRMDLQHPGDFEKVFCVKDDDESLIAISCIPETDDFCLFMETDREDSEKKCYINYFNAEGKLIKSIDMTGTFPDIDERTINAMAVDKEGNYYFKSIGIPDDEIVVCNADGQKTGTIQFNAVSDGFTYDKDMNLYYPDSDKEEKKTYLKHAEDKRIESILLPQKDERIDFVSETRGGILLRTEQGLWTLTENGARLLVDFAQEGMDNKNVKDICMAPDGSIYMTLWGSDIGYEPRLYRFTADGQSGDRQNRTKICIAGRSIGEDVKSAVSDFNMAQDKILVQTEEYGTDEAGEKKLLMDITSSDTIDLLCVQDRYEMKNPERYLENLYPLMAEAGLTDNILDACCDREAETGFFAFPGYSLHTMFLLGKQEGDTMTLKQFRDLLDDSKGKNNVLHKSDRYAMFLQMLRANIGEIYKADEKDVDIELLHEIAQTCMAVTEEDEEGSLPSHLRSGDCIGAVVDLYEPCDYMMYLEMMEGKGAYVGLPVAEPVTGEEGFSGNTIMPMGGIYGVLQQSAHKEEAFEFIRYLLGEEYQMKRCYPGQIPVSEKGLDRMMEIVTADRETVLEDGTELSPYSIEVGYEEYSITVDALTAEEEAAFRKLLASADRIYEMDGALSEMISEEMEQYFSGKRDLESTDDILKERIGIYLNE